MKILSLASKRVPSFSHLKVAAGEACRIWQENLAKDPTDVTVFCGSHWNFLDIPLNTQIKKKNKIKNQ